MSASAESLILHLIFEEVKNNMVEDASDYDHDCTLHGTRPPQLIPDDNFGSCLSFDGVDEYVSLPDLQGDYAGGLTIEAWVFYSSFDLPSKIIDLGNGPGSDNIILMAEAMPPNEASSPSLSLSIYRGSAQQTLSADNVLRLNEWMHLAATIDPQANATLYMNGEEVKSGSLQLPQKVDRRNNYLAKGNWPTDPYFQGKLASIRVYSSALSAEEINLDMQEDQTAAASFRTTHPLDFNLFDDDDQQVLYIADDSSAGENLHLEITNSSRQSMEMAQPNGNPPGVDNHHFELRFRPGTLSASSLNSIRLAESDWQMAKAQQADGTISLFLLSAAAMTLAPTAKIKLTLQHVNADAGAGARGTRVELRYQQLQYAGSTTSVNGSRVQHLSIVNHSGKKNIPLHVGFVGSNTILNDAGETASDLKLRITNLQVDQSLTLNTIETSAPTRFVLSFDGQDEDESKEWALGSDTELAKVEIHWGLLGTLAEATVSGEPAEPLTLSITPALDRDLAAGTSLGVVSQAGDSVVAVVANTAFRGQSAIRIQPLSTQQISILEQGAEVYLRDVVWKADEPSLQGITPQWTFTNQSQVEIGPSEGIQLRITNIRSSLPSGYANLYVRYENIPGYWDGQYVCAIEKAPILYRQNYVGIGTTKPGFPLTIRGASTSEELLGFEDTNGQLKWHLNQKLDAAPPGLNIAESRVADGRLFIRAGGNVGIGTTSPQAKLHVSQGAIMPEQGNSEQAGLLFPKDPGGGSGDAAWIRYYPVSGEATTLEIGVANNADDNLALTASGKIGLTAANDIALTAAGSIALTASGSIALMAAGSVGIGTTTSPQDFKLAASAASQHLQLRRETNQRVGGKVLFLELFQADQSPAAVPEVYPSIRFHHQSRYWQRIEARSDGIHFKGGNLDSDSYTLIYADQGVFDGSVKLGSATSENYVGRGANFHVNNASFKTHSSGNYSWTNTSSNTIRIAGADGGVLATKDVEVLEWHTSAVIINGSIWAKDKYFLIQHPVKPDHQLAHACLEGPEVGVYYRGTARLENGEATVKLPAYFEALTRKEGRTVMLTAIGAEPYRLSYEEIKDGQFKVYGSKARGQFSWEVKAVRADVNPLEVEIKR